MLSKPTIDPASRPMAALASALTVVATALLGWEAARVTWQLWPHTQTAAPLTHKTAGHAAAGVSNMDRDHTRIAAAHLFGKANQTPTDTPRNAPETQLDLTLKGVLAGNDQRSGVAIIASSGNGDQLFLRGDELPGGATLGAIYQDRVILNRNGRHEALHLPAGALASTATANSQSSDQSKPISEDATLAGYRSKLRHDPGALQRLLQPAPVRDASGNISGFRIGGGDQDLLAATGLQSGDVVTTVDNIRLDDQQAAMRAIQRLSNAQRVTLTVSRNGNQRRVVLDFGSQG